MKKKGLRITSFIVLVIIMLTMGATVSNAAPQSSEDFVPEPPRYTETSLKNWYRLENDADKYRIDTAKMRLNGKKLDGGSFPFNKDDVLSFDFQTEQAEDYIIVLEYKSFEESVNDCRITVKCDTETAVAALPILWADKTGNYSFDRNGNHQIPEQIAVDGYICNPLEDVNSSALSKLVFRLAAGKHTISLAMNLHSLEIKNIYVMPETKIPEYSQYLEAHNSRLNENGETVTIEGEAYSVKSDAYIRGKNVSNAALYPYDTYRKLINVIDENSWGKSGQKILWEFNVTQSGWYQIGFRYSRSSSVIKPAYRSVEIDGELPYDKLSAVSFPRTAADSYKNLIIKNNNEPLWIYLEKGIHTIALRAETDAETESIYRELMTLMEDINALAMELKKLTAGQSDNSRTWDMNVYMPETVPSVKRFIERAKELYDRLEKLSGEKPVYADSLNYAVQIMNDLLEDEMTIPNNAGLLNSGDNSASKNIAVVLNNMLDQQLSIDRIYITGSGDLPKAKAPVWKSLYEALKRFLNSYVPDTKQKSYGASHSKKGELSVWVNRPMQYVQLLQQILDADYNVKNGTDIRLSVMPNEQKLILSNASGTNPDLVLGVGYGTPFDFAIRGAAKNLLDYDGFLEFYNSQYNIENLVAEYYDHGIYGAIETLDFQVMFYRSDILDTLGLSVPNTWDDVEQMLPRLLRYSMNFGLPLASGSSLKGYNQTAPYIYENGGYFYAANGASVAIREENAIRAFQEMTDLFSIYGAQSVVPSFYNSFRFGEIPIGISGFGTYLQLQTAAPELSGRWKIALTPGTEQPDGTIVRNQMAASTACMIFENTKQEEEAGRFLMWWLSKETQRKFAYLLKTTYGPAYTWNTANIEAFKELDYPEEHKEIILKQWENQKENLRHPANYMVEREVSNIWNDCIVNGKPLIESIDEAVIISDREIIRKLSEFGYCDKDGRLNRDYSTNAIEEIRKMLDQKG